jgi:hypothetical protein
MMQSRDEKVWRVYVTYENALSGDGWGPLETLAEAKARLKEEEKWSRQNAWIVDANFTNVAAEHFKRLSPHQQDIVRQAMKNNPQLLLIEALEELGAFGL